MRPYANGKTPKTPGTGKRPHSRRGDKLGDVNGVKKGLLKAKVTAVKAKHRLRGADKEEVKDLLEQSITTTTVVTPKKAAPKSNLPQKLKKSVSNLEQEIKKRTTRSSTKQEPEAEPQKKPDYVDEVDFVKNQNGLQDVEMAEEATERPQTSGPGFLKRAVSKLWKIPVEGLNGVPYTDINSAPASPTPAPRNPENGINGGHHNGETKVDAVAPAKSCVIS